MYYPDQRYRSEMMRIRRKSVLPEIAIGNIQVKEGQVVDVHDTVARGMIPARHILINAAEELGLKDPQKLNELMLVDLRTRVDEGRAIAGKNPEKGRRILAPIAGIVIYVGDGRIVMQETPEIISLEAGVRGRVTKIHEGRGVSLEATGAVIQGVWGNDRHAVTTLRIEPEKGGLTSIVVDTLDTTYSNEIVVTRKPLDVAGLNVARGRAFGGLIAPSIDASLLNEVMQLSFPVMLTEGFGDRRMQGSLFHLLQEYDGSAAMLDAAQPQRFADRRPELVINRPTNEEVPDFTFTAIEEDTEVRIVRAPYAGEAGIVDELPQHLTLLQNGLRLRSAVVKLSSGEFVDVPLANLELAGT